jgi:hypothetical protein
MEWPAESKESSPASHSVVFFLRLITRVAAFGGEHCSRKFRGFASLRWEASLQQHQG